MNILYSNSTIKWEKGERTYYVTYIFWQNLNLELKKWEKREKERKHIYWIPYLTNQIRNKGTEGNINGISIKITTRNNTNLPKYQIKDCPPQPSQKKKSKETDHLLKW